MFKDLKITAVLAVKDLNRARDFYRDKLGLDGEETQDGIIYTCGGGTRFLAYQSDYAGTAQSTQIAWETDDVERTVGELRDAGVKIEDYDLPGLKTVNGIATMSGEKSAWFTDSEGNIHAVTQQG